MTLFPFTRPRMGLHVTADALSVAHVNRRLGRQSFGGYVEQPLPSGAIRLSPVEPNILEQAHVINSLQSVLGRVKGPQSVALCLPDFCARTTVLEMATLPQKKQEQQALVEWRLRQDLNLAKENMRISYQILSSPSWGFTGPPNTDQPVRLLATAIQERIIEAYEAVCLEVGLIPTSIHLASLAVFNMCRPLMDATLDVMPERIAFVPDTLFFLYLADWGFSIIAIHHRTPYFLRVKALRPFSPWPSPVPPQSPEEFGPPKQEKTASSIEESPEPLSSIQPDAVLTSPPPQATMIANEVVGTLQYYFETHEASAVTDGAYPLFLVGSQAPDSALPLIAELIQQEFPIEADSAQPRIRTFPVFPGNADLNLKALSSLPAWTSASLPAFAATGQSA